MVRNIKVYSYLKYRQISSEKAPSIELLTLEDKIQNNLPRLYFVNFK